MAECGVARLRQHSETGRHVACGNQRGWCSGYVCVAMALGWQLQKASCHPLRVALWKLYRGCDGSWNTVVRKTEWSHLRATLTHKPSGACMGTVLPWPAKAPGWIQVLGPRCFSYHARESFYETSGAYA